MDKWKKKKTTINLIMALDFFSTCTRLCIVTSDFKKAMKENYDFFNKSKTYIY